MRHFEFPLFFFFFFSSSQSESHIWILITLVPDCTYWFITYCCVSGGTFWEARQQAAGVNDQQTLGSVHLTVCASDGKKVTSGELNCREKVRTVFLKSFLRFRESNDTMRSTFLLNPKRLRVSQQVLYSFCFYLCSTVCVDSSTRWFHFHYSIWDDRLISGRTHGGFLEIFNFYLQIFWLPNRL